MKKIIITTSILLLVISTLVFFYFKESFSSKDESYLFSFVPLHATMVIELKNDKSIYDLYKTNDLFKTLVYDSYVDDLSFLNSFFLENNAFKAALAGKTILASVHKAKSDKCDVLYTTFCKGSLLKNPRRVFEKFLSSEFTLSERNVEGEKVYELFSSKADRTLVFCSLDGVLMVSYTPSLIEDAIRQHKTGKSLENEPDFKRTHELKGKQTIAALYINYKRFSELLETLLKSQQYPSLNVLKDLAAFSVFDINFKSDAWMLNGRTITKNTHTDLLDPFSNQTPKKPYLSGYFSNRTAAFVHIGLSNFAQYQADVTSSFNAKKDFTRDSEMKKINRKYDLKLEQDLIEFLDGELAVTLLDNDGQYGKEEKLAFVKLRNSEAAANFLDHIQKQEIEAGAVLDTQSYHQFTIFPMFIKKFMFLAGGKLFNDFESNFYVIIEDRLIMASDPQTLKSYIDNYISLQILSENSNYKEITNAIADQSNLFFYGNAEHASRLLESVFNDKAKTVYESSSRVKQYNALTVQFSSSKSGFFTTLYLPKAKEQAIETQLLWKIQLDSAIYSMPYVVENTETKEKEIIVQDNSNKLYLISSSGKLLWKTQINGKIISDIYQVDYYKNGQLQFLFNTANQLYLMDRNGQMMPRYPIRLSTNATCGLALFDYDQDKNYRIFISCINKSIFGYDISGRPLDGWNPKADIGILSYPIQHVLVEGKDYLFVNNTNGDFYFFNRRGDLLFKFLDTAKTSYQNPFIFDSAPTLSKSRFINTDINGKVKSVFLDGRILYKHIGNWSPDHFFNYVNVTGNKTKEYVYLDKNQLIVYQNDSVIAFNYEFKSDVKHPPQFFSDTAGHYSIGVTLSESNQIFLFNEDGSLKKGFPLLGGTSFQLSKLRVSTKTNVIVASRDKYVYVYELGL